MGRTVRALAATVATAVVAGCGSQPQRTSGEAEVTLVASDRERVSPASDVPTTEAAQGLLAFGFELIRDNPQLVETGNVVLSPASIGAAFAMARAGARGETAEQIDAVLHFPTHDLGGAYNAMTRGWTASPAEKNAPELSIANAVFGQLGFPLDPDYLDALAEDFGAGVRTVDFADGSAAQVINDWVKEQTRDRIKELFDELDPATRLVLANAVYLKATWEHQFLAELTTRQPFHRADGTEVRSETMHTPPEYERFSYAATDEWAAVRMPYVGGELAMWVLLPSARDGDPVALLDPAVLAAAKDTAQSQRVDLSLPKWDFQSTLPLDEALQTLGMTEPFNSEADFSGISSATPPIDQVMHRADITVDEKGTEAAAATGIAFAESAPPPADAVMDVDHPFAFVVVHEPTGAPLFEGVMGDPTATR